MAHSDRLAHDFYAEWLGIPPGQRPPDHYALLGLERGESDQTVIQHAVQKRMTLVRPRCLKHPDAATKLLNEIAAARVCLTDPIRKDTYDRRLLSERNKPVASAALHKSDDPAAIDVAEFRRMQSLVHPAVPKPSMPPPVPDTEESQNADQPCDDLDGYSVLKDLEHPEEPKTDARESTPNWSPVGPANVDAEKRRVQSKNVPPDDDRWTRFEQRASRRAEATDKEYARKRTIAVVVCAIALLFLVLKLTGNRTPARPVKSSDASPNSSNGSVRTSKPSPTGASSTPPTTAVENRTSSKEAVHSAPSTGAPSSANLSKDLPVQNDRDLTKGEDKATAGEPIMGWVINGPVTGILSMPPKSVIEQRGVAFDSSCFDLVRAVDGSVLEVGTYHLFKIATEGAVSVEWTGQTTGNTQVLCSIWNGSRWKSTSHPGYSGDTIRLVLTPQDGDRSAYFMVNGTQGRTATDCVRIVEPADKAIASSAGASSGLGQEPSGARDSTSPPSAERGGEAPEVGMPDGQGPKDAASERPPTDGNVGPAAPSGHPKSKPSGTPTRKKVSEEETRLAQLKGKDDDWYFVWATSVAIEYDRYGKEIGTEPRRQSDVVHGKDAARQRLSEMRILQAKDRKKNRGDGIAYSTREDALKRKEAFDAGKSK